MYTQQIITNLPRYNLINISVSTVNPSTVSDTSSAMVDLTL